MICTLDVEKILDKLKAKLTKENWIEVDDEAWDWAGKLDAEGRRKEGIMLVARLHAYSQEKGLR